MNIIAIPSFIRFLLILTLVSSLTGCLHWMRAFQTYLQLREFDQYFTVNDQDNFSVYFNSPILYSDDFLALSKLQPSNKQALENGEKWRYTFRKVDQKKIILKPELSFFFDLEFNQQQRISAWIFSELFLEIAPPKFLEASLRSLAYGKLDKEKRQLKANSHVKVEGELPQKDRVIARLGKPIEIKDEGAHEVYYYHFLLESPKIEKGYEERALSIVKLTFDKKNHELTQMAGRFAGLKISIKYKRYLANAE
jgi:hypothetical protein